MSRVERIKGLRTRGLTVRYGGVVANTDVDIEVRPGQIVGLIGPNGAGKSTFVDAVTGFTAYEGRVELDGASIDSLPTHLRHGRGLSRTWQSGELFGNLSVRENLMVATSKLTLTTWLRDIFVPRRAEGRGVVEELLGRVGLGAAIDQLARELTLGQQKLVGVARALASDCSVVLLDEPAAGLDHVESEGFGKRLRIVADGGTAVLLIDHDMSLVLGVCDYVYVMKFGEIIFAGHPAAVRTDPTVINAYLGAPTEIHDA